MMPPVWDSLPIFYQPATVSTCNSKVTSGNRLHFSGRPLCPQAQGTLDILIVVRRTAQILLFANTVIWIGLAVSTAIRAASGSSASQVGYMGIALLMLGNAGAFLLAGLALNRPGRLTWLFTLGILAVNIILTFTDEVGALDLITAALDTMIVGLLIATSKQFWH
jgi:hypothetical protein